MNMSQSVCLVERPKTFEHRVNGYIQYSPWAKDIEGVLLKHWHIVGRDPNVKKCFGKPLHVVSKRQTNLHNSLV